MENDVKKINVRIGGMTYNLVSGESEAYTRQIAARADEMIRRVAMSSPQLSQQMTTILALVNAADELIRQAAKQSLAEQQCEATEIKNAELRAELSKARELNWEMKKEILRLSALVREQDRQPGSRHEPVAAAHADAAAHVSAAATPATATAPTSATATPTSAAAVAVPDAAFSTASQARPTGSPLKNWLPNAWSEPGEPASETATTPAPTTVPVTTPVPEATSTTVVGAAGHAEARTPRPLTQLRQTGLDEYLSNYSQARSTVDDLRSNDEP